MRMSSPAPLHTDTRSLQFVTSYGTLNVIMVLNKTNYIAVGGVDYVTMLAEQELLGEG